MLRSVQNSMRIIAIFLGSLVGMTGCQVSQVPKAVDHTSFRPNSSTEIASPDAVGKDIQVASHTEDENPVSSTDLVDMVTTAGTAVQRPLTLLQLEQMALDANPAISKLAARVEALRGKWLQVGLPPNPTAGYSAAEIGDDGRAGQQGGFVGQQFITGGKLRLNRAVVQEQLSKAEQEWETARTRVLTDVRIGFYDVLIAQEKIDLTQQLVRVSEKAVETSKKLLEAKEISEVGLLQTTVDAQNAQIVAENAKNEYNAAWRSLSTIISCPKLSQQRLHGNLHVLEAPLDWDDQLKRLSSQSPEVAVAIAELRRAQRGLDRAEVQVLPNLNVQVGTQYDNASGDMIASVQVGLPVPIWNRNQGGIQQARGNITAARRDLERVELNLQQRLAEAFQRYNNAQFQVRKYNNEILPKAKKTYDLVSHVFESGQAGYLDLLTAQRTYFTTNIQYLESLRSLWRSRLQITGYLLDGSLSNSSEALIQ